MPATHAETFLTRENGDSTGLSPRTSEAMTQAGHHFLLQRANGMQVPAEFGSCEIVDGRSNAEKLGDFVAAATRRATDPKGWKQYFEEEAQKAIGVGEGLNIAKEETKKAVSGACQVVVDGRAWNALLHAPELLKPAAQITGHALDAMSHDPNAVNKLAGSVCMSVVEASNGYSHLAPHEKGKVIGQVMFAMINPEGSTEGASVAMKAADNIATHVDAAVVSGIQKSMKAIEEIQQSAPEMAQQAKHMLRDYTRQLGLSEPELQYAGVPKGYFDATKPLGAPEKSDLTGGKDSGQNPAGIMTSSRKVMLSADSSVAIS